MPNPTPLPPAEARIEAAHPDCRPSVARFVMLPTVHDPKWAMRVHYTPGERHPFHMLGRSNSGAAFRDVDQMAPYIDGGLTDDLRAALLALVDAGVGQ